MIGFNFLNRAEALSANSKQVLVGFLIGFSYIIIRVGHNGSIDPVVIPRSQLVLASGGLFTVGGLLVLGLRAMALVHRHHHHGHVHRRSRSEVAAVADRLLHERPGQQREVGRLHRVRHWHRPLRKQVVLTRVHVLRLELGVAADDR